MCTYPCIHSRLVISFVGGNDVRESEQGDGQLGSKRFQPVHLVTGAANCAKMGKGQQCFDLWVLLGGVKVFTLQIGGDVNTKIFEDFICQILII
jgi:hypothetical protein